MYPKDFHIPTNHCIEEVYMFYDTLLTFQSQLKYVIGISKKDRKFISKLIKKIEHGEDVLDE